MAGEIVGDPAAPPESETGNQTPSDGVPAPVEAEQSENANVETPASGFGEVKRDHRVPFDRFQKVNNQRKEAEAKATELQNQLELLQSRPPESSGAVSDQLKSLAETARDNFNDPDRFVEAISKMAQLSAQGTASQTLEGLLQQQQQQAQQQQFMGVVEQSWNQATTEFPDLKDSNSALFKEAAAEYDSDPSLKDSPTGMYRAAQSAYLRRMMHGGGPQTPAQLEGNAPAPPTVAGGDLAKDLEILSQRGTREDVKEFLKKHQPWKKPE